MPQICRNRWGTVIECPTNIGVEQATPPVVVGAGEDDLEAAGLDLSRPTCNVVLPNFEVRSARDVAKAFNFIRKNNPISCVGPALEAFCVRIPVSIRNRLPRGWRGWCNQNTQTISTDSFGMEGLGAYSTKDQIVEAVNAMKRSGSWQKFNEGAADLMANTTPEAAKFLPSPFRQMYAAERRGGLGDAASSASEAADIFSKWVSALSNAAGQITNNYVQIRSAKQGIVPVQGGPILTAPDNTMLYVGGGIAALLVLGLVMSKR